MRYVDAGYTIALVVLALYSASLLLRRRRLTRAAAAAERDAGLRAPAVSPERPVTR